MIMFRYSERTAIFCDKNCFFATLKQFLQHFRKYFVVLLNNMVVTVTTGLIK